MASHKILFIAPPQAVTAFFPALKEDGYEAGIAENLSGALSFIKKSSAGDHFLAPDHARIPRGGTSDRKRARFRFSSHCHHYHPGFRPGAQKYLEAGAKDYWLEPLSWEKISAALPQPSAKVGAASKPGSADAKPIIGKHPAIARVLALAKQVARSKATVLISGDSGTGKEMIAKYLHNNSDRADKPFIAVNCAALPEHLLESELFGHEKGAFTGAINRKPGKFELADKGTILLDEISEMDLGLQAKLLRVLQESELDRLGGVESIKVDVRVLATTNRALQEWVEAGKFRQDLFFRLNVIPLKLPSLRDRGDDVLVLAKFFVDKFRNQYGIPPLAISTDAVEWLKAYDWPGNVRELQNLMERAVLLAGNGPISKSHFLLDDEFWPQDDDLLPQVEDSGDIPHPLKGESLENILGGSIMPLQEMERIMIMRGLEHTSGNRTQAADLLGISVRTLRNKLNEYRSQGLEIP